MKRQEIASLICGRLESESARLSAFFRESGPIGYFVVDDLLPEAIAREIGAAFPSAGDMTFKDTLRERKYIASQMNRYNPLLEEALYAFHDERVVRAVQAIINHPSLYPDPMLYAGGISRMERTGFLNPHIDNSHDKERKHWRSLNLLYYATPDWQAASGGNLEIWPHGTKDAPVTIASSFNRLAVMSTHQHSWHSVSPIHATQARCCVSNYYFSDQPMHPLQQFHVTSFRGRPEQFFTDVALRADALLRMGLRRIKRGGIFNTGHWYEKAA